jgi:hypothetical protein
MTSKVTIEKTKWNDKMYKITNDESILVVSLPELKQIVKLGEEIIKKMK